MHKSFKPGLTQTQRYILQDSSNYYRTQYPSTGFSTRITSFATRVASMESRNREDTSSAMRDMKKKSLQATCKDLKNEVNRASSMADYNIKTKHMENMSGFLASKNFELVTRVGTPAGDKPDSKANKPQLNKKASGQKSNTGDTDDKKEDDNKTFVCKENIEKDKDEEML